MDIILKVQKLAKKRNKLLTEWAESQRNYITNLSKEDKKILFDYCSFVYELDSENINIEKNIAKVYLDYPKIIEKIIEIITNSPKLSIPLKLFRGITDVHPIDNLIINPYLSSTSFKKEIAKSYISKRIRQKTRSSLYVLNMPANFPGLLLGNRNDYEKVPEEFKNRFEKEINPSFEDEYEVLTIPFIGTTTSTGEKNDVKFYNVDNIIFPKVNYKDNSLIIHF
jgi:hypothetical protein